MVPEEQVELFDINTFLGRHLIVDGSGDRWYICWPDGEHFIGPYLRAQDAKGQLTRLTKHG
jgi:hypothetical protein